MAWAKPIVSNAVGGMEDPFQAHKAGLLVQSQELQAWVEPIARLIDNPDLARELEKTDTRQY